MAEENTVLENVGDSEDNRKILTAPKLPNVVKGDGRYLMTLLNDFLTEMAGQVNLANGFLAEEIDYAQDGVVPTPRNFSLTFNRLGARLSWDHIMDVGILKYYETREDTNVGSKKGLLDTTIDNFSFKILITFVGTVYLYAVGRDGSYSNFTRINYTKPRPHAPKNLALSKNNEGTLIYFDPIPTDCIGANIYINGNKHQVLDNLFLFTEEGGTIETLCVAYYDSFGEGELEYLYVVPPDITRFMAERNGAYLDFYWDSIPIYGVKYIVKVGQTYEGSLEVFATKDNKHRLVYPITGESIFWIKAIDEHGNVSKNPAYVSTANILDINKNIILRFEQEPVHYPGNKINTYYDIKSQGIKLDKDALYGEYITEINLPQVYRARNWVDYKVLGITNGNLKVTDFDFTGDSKEAAITTWLGTPGDLEGTVVKSQIARYIGASIYDIDIFGLNRTLAGIKGTAPTESLRSGDYRPGRWADGLFVSDLTRVVWDLKFLSETFNLTFHLKITESINMDMVIMTLWQTSALQDLKPDYFDFTWDSSEAYMTTWLGQQTAYLIIGFDNRNKVFYLLDNRGNRLEVEISMTERDWLAFGVSQGKTKRRFFVSSLGTGRTIMAEGDLPPVGVFEAVYLYGKII